MSASTSVGNLTGNQVRLAEALEMSLSGLSRDDLDTRKLRTEVRRHALKRRGLEVGSKVKYPGTEVLLFIAETDYEGGDITLSSQNPSDSKPRNADPIGIRVAIKRFLQNFSPPALEDGGKTWI